MSIGSPLITKYLAQQPLTRYKQQPCLFACSASLPAPPRVVSTWLPHSRDQRNKCCVAAIKVNTPAKENVYQTNAEFSLQNHKQTSDYSRNGSRSLIYLPLLPLEREKVSIVGRRPLLSLRRNRMLKKHTWIIGIGHTRQAVRTATQISCTICT